MFLNRLLLFIMALCLGSLLVRMHLPIPFLLGGLLTALLCKTLTRICIDGCGLRYRFYLYLGYLE